MLSGGLARVKLGTLVFFQAPSDGNCGISSFRINLGGTLLALKSNCGQFFLGGRECKYDRLILEASGSSNKAPHKEVHDACMSLFELRNRSLHRPSKGGYS